MTETGPCLVEVNSRCHGANGSWMPLALALTGYSQARFSKRVEILKAVQAADLGSHGLITNVPI